MKLLHAVTVLTLIFSQTAFSRCQRRVGGQNAIMAALQNIFQPPCNEALPIALPNSQFVQDVVPVMPNRIVPREIMPNMRVIEPRCPCQDPYPRMPEVITLNMPAPIVPAPVMPAPVPFYPQAVAEVPVPYLPIPEKAACPYSCAQPAPLVSPFLPAASPVSPWAPPTSNLLPPVIPNQTRSHFLRKIPIPPPTL